MKKTFLMLLCSGLFLCLNAQNKYKQYTDNLPFKMAEVKALSFPRPKCR